MKKVIGIIILLFAFVSTTFATEELPFELKGEYISSDGEFTFVFSGDTLTIGYTDGCVISTYKLHARCYTLNTVRYDGFELYPDDSEGYRQVFIIITKGYNYQFWKDYWIEYRGIDKGDTYSNIDKAYIIPKKVLK